MTTDRLNPQVDQSSGVPQVSVDTARAEKTIYDVGAPTWLDEHAVAAIARHAYGPRIDEVTRAQNPLLRDPDLRASVALQLDAMLYPPAAS